MQGEFPILVLNDMLSRGQVKGGSLGVAPLQKQKLAVLATDLLPGICLRLIQYGSDSEASQRRIDGQRFRIAAVAIIFRVGTQTGTNRVKIDVSANGCQSL